MYSQLSRYYNVDTSNNIPQSNMIKNNYDYTEFTVSADEENRLDLVSYHVYDTPVYWWLIARFNAIINPNYIPVGTILKIPKIQV